MPSKKKAASSQKSPTLGGTRGRTKTTAKSAKASTAGVRSAKISSARTGGSRTASGKTASGKPAVKTTSAKSSTKASRTGSSKAASVKARAAKPVSKTAARGATTARKNVASKSVAPKRAVAKSTKSAVSKTSAVSKSSANVSSAKKAAVAKSSMSKPASRPAPSKGVDVKAVVKTTAAVKTVATPVAAAPNAKATVSKANPTAAKPASSVVAKAANAKTVAAKPTAPARVQDNSTLAKIKAVGATREALSATRASTQTSEAAKQSNTKLKDISIASAVAAPTPIGTAASQGVAAKVAHAPSFGASRPTVFSKPPVASESSHVAKKSIENAIPAAPSHAEPVASDASRLAQQPAKPKATSPKHGFKMNEFIVYPAHGVGQIVGVEIQEVAGFSLELFVVTFIKDKMILKVPTSKVVSVGMRKLSESDVVDKALGTLSGRARIKRTMWSRRAQEYEAKINSGDLVTIAEVVRDLFRTDAQPEQSYSERQLYEAALDRMAREISAARKLIDAEALKLIEAFLMKGPRRGKGGDADIVDDPGDDPDVERAA
jgi:CarD family transcriptional regulator